ncbi:MAG: 4a-hydroxytetrahydrobiopterin dehydratase [Anaerolineae bacterium]|nr:4a-hydroxytetrahydrobiopterin dehydratase [Anaerolineae bacterium]
MKRFSTAEITKNLAHMPGWKWDTGFLRKTFFFENPIQAALFLNAVGYLAEMEDHQPSMTVNASQVTLSLQTRAVKGLTQKDFELARKIEGLVP